MYFANPDPVDYYYMFVLIDETKWAGQPEIVGSLACNPSRYLKAKVQKHTNRHKSGAINKQGIQIFERDPRSLWTRVFYLLG